MMVVIPMSYRLALDYIEYIIGVKTSVNIKFEHKMTSRMSEK